MMPKTIVCDTEHVIAIEQDLGGDSVVVTFNEMGFLRKDLRFWGDDFLLAQGISAFGIVTPRPNWYPHRAMEEVIAAVLEKIKGRKVVTYGHGQGGYGALKFSARLKASVALTFCPQWSINPADVASFDSRFAGYFAEALTSGLRIEQEDLCNCAFIVFDRMQKLDAAHVAKLAALGGVKTIVAPFFMNDIARLAPEGGSAARLIELCTSETPPAATDLRQVIRASRRGSRSYLNAMLRQLMLRMSQSGSHSSVFVSSLLDKTNNSENPFYTALFSHAKGKDNLALSELRRVTAKHLKRRDLLPLWRLANKLRFAEAELTVAAQICETHTANTPAGLCAVNTLVRAGKEEDAYRELMRLTKQGDAANHIDQFVEFSRQLRKPDVIEHFLSDALPRSAKVSVLFGLVDCYRELGDRATAFRKLMDLAQTCADSPDDLRRVAACFVELGELSKALDIRRGLLRSAPGDYWLALDVVDVKARTPLGKDKKRADVEFKKIRAELTEIMKAPDLPSAAWERASHLYEDLGDLEAALLAIRKAVEGFESGFEMRHRLVVLLARKGRKRSARHELEALFRECRKDPKRIRMLGIVAWSLRDRRLARKFAEAQFESEPTNPESILYLAQQLRMIGDRIRAQRLLCDLFHSERRSPYILDHQWVRLAQELYEVGNVTLAKEAITEAKTRKPNSAKVQKLAATIALTEKLGESGSTAPPREDVPELMQLGFFSRLAKIFRR
jgi:tetratricopeptide (TPR) repeat protein